MPRIARLKVKGEPAVYHVVSRTTLDGFVLGDVEKEHLLELIKRLGGFYLCEILGFSLMGNHFHLLVRVHPEIGYSDEEIRERYDRRYGEEKAAVLDDNQMRVLRKKMGDLFAQKIIREHLSVSWTGLQDRLDWFIKFKNNPVHPVNPV